MILYFDLLVGRVWIFAGEEAGVVDAAVGSGVDLFDIEAVGLPRRCEDSWREAEEISRQFTQMLAGLFGGAFGRSHFCGAV